VPKLPKPRGPLSELLFDALVEPPHAVRVREPGDDEDLQLSLYVLYELHYRSFDGVADGWEWEPSVLALRARLEADFEAALRAEVGPLEADGAVPELLEQALAAGDGPPLSRYLECQASAEQFREFVVHRSAYQLKEADPHSWAIPRLAGAPKVALVEIQSDEYGGGRPERQHARLFADTMQALGLDATYGAYLDRIPGVTLATVNLMSLCGLHRRLRGAIVGHLAALEMDSTLPNRRYGNGLRRLGLEAATEFYDEHVEADAVHEALAANDLAAAFAAAEPELAGDVVFGARAMVKLDTALATHIMDRWARGESSLREPLPRGELRLRAS